MSWNDSTQCGQSSENQYSEEALPGSLRLPKGTFLHELISAEEPIERVKPDQLPQFVRTSIAREVAPGSMTRAVWTSWSDFRSLGIAAILCELLDGGHELQVLLHQPVLSTAPNQAWLNRLLAFGAEVRVTRWGLPDMVVLGAGVIAVNPQPHHELPQVVHVRNREFGDALLHLHSALWEHAVDLASARRADLVHADPTRCRVLAYLCSGVLDDTAAREMDISVRTYRRYVARILNDLAVTSRFQAGVKAAELGLTAARSPEQLVATAGGGG